MSTNILVEFKGERYWLIADADGDCGALAPLEHVDETGHIAFEHAFDSSFAHLFPDGRLMRHGRQIGTRDDVKQVRQ